jgi:UDP-2,3-diacylglucosamine hydrolase
MDYSLFISDLHLCESRPELIKSFTHFLKHTAAQANALYILGDLFEYWAGDDTIEVGIHAQTISALNKLSQQGVSIYLMHGNRDFLLGDVFSKATNTTILPDPSLISLHGKSILLSHGDTLCTDDVAYQQFRTEVRSDTWKAQFLNKPLSDRIDYIESLRAKSEQEKSIKSMEIMDVNLSAVAQMFKEYNYPSTLVHGHTHRPNRHLNNLEGHACERWVLADWYDQGSYLRLDKLGFHAHQL